MVSKSKRKAGESNGPSVPRPALVVRGFELSRVGLVAPDGAPFEDWQDFGNYLRFCEGAVHWWIGDWLNYGERHYGEKYSQALEATGFDYSTLAHDKYVAGRIEFCRRRQNLPWSHHADVAALDPDEQDAMLDQAEEHGWGQKDFRQAIREHKRLAASQDAGRFPPGKFRVLLADPPWEYSDQRTAGRATTAREASASGSAAAQYRTLSTDLICALRDTAGLWVGNKAADDAALFLWATAPCLPDAFRVLAAWGFDYKAQFVWDKGRGFNGHYNDVQHELLLVALRGSCPPSCESLTGSIVRAEKTAHSRKPDVFYQIVETLYPPAAAGEPPSHLELFQRRPRDRWAGWGDEA